MISALLWNFRQLGKYIEILLNFEIPISTIFVLVTSLISKEYLLLFCRKIKFYDDCEWIYSVVMKWDTKFIIVHRHYSPTCWCHIFMSSMKNHHVPFYLHQWNNKPTRYFSTVSVQYPHNVVFSKIYLWAMAMYCSLWRFAS